MGFGAGDSNLYRYVGNSPTNYTDPTGNFAMNWGALASINWSGVALSSLVSLTAAVGAPDAVQSPKSACDIKPGDNSLTRAGIEILGNLGLGIFTTTGRKAISSLMDFVVALTKQVDNAAPSTGTNIVSNAVDDLPEILFSRDSFSVKATIPGDPKAYARIELPELGIANITDIFKGGLPKGGGSDLLAKTLQSQGVSPSKQLVFKNIINSPTIEAFEAGLNPADTVMGKVGQRTLEKLGLTPSSFRFEVNRGKLDLIIDVK
jgi:hypothetical protein